MTTTNKRIKKCNYCGDTFIDNTRPINKKTCSKECADEVRKARQRKDYRKENPRQPNQRELYYHDQHEYPFWSNDEVARNQMWKEAAPYAPEKIESIAIAREMYEYNGGRKRRQEALSYDGDEMGSHGVSVQFVKHMREPSEVTTYKMTPEELAEYLKNKKVDKI